MRVSLVPMRVWLVLLAGVVACGDSVVLQPGETDTTTTSTGSGTTTTDTSTGTTTDPTTTTDPMPEAVYTAISWPGGLDHMIIMRRSDAQDSCIRVMLDSPVMGGPYNLTAPDSWAVGHIETTDEAGDCLDWQAPLQGTSSPVTMASGAITWRAMPGSLYPCELSIDAVVTLDPVPAWSSGQETLAAIDIPVDAGCP